jgi:predicted membrane-bound dolichyl-phosphate-mannose-protein mannosyltransferase
MAAGELPSTRGGLMRYLVRPLAIDWSSLLLMLLIVASFGFRMLWLDKPDGSLIFDEAYYVNAARVILGWPVAQGDPYAGAQPGFDPNTEHPPGAKLLIAGSMWLWGDNALGWRFASVVVGTLSIPLLYGIARHVGATKPMALLATYLYAFDNLVLVHSRIATLDIFLVSFLLLGLYCYLAGKPMFAGLAFVAATLCKITGIYGIAAVIAFEGLRFIRGRLEQTGWKRAPRHGLLVVIVVYVALFPALLGVLDHTWSREHKHPVDHIRHIFSYGFALTRPEGPRNQESAPWQWLVNEVPMTYLRADEQVLVNNEVETTRPIIFFRGAMNPYVIFMAPLAIAFAAYGAFKQRDDYAFLVLSLFIVTYAPFWPAAIWGHRISYLFYFLATIPAIAMGISQFMYAPHTPRIVRWTYIGAVLLGFYAYFPFPKVP